MEDEDSIKKKQLEKEMEKKDQHTNITGRGHPSPCSHCNWCYNSNTFNFIESL